MCGGGCHEGCGRYARRRWRVGSRWGDGSGMYTGHRVM